MITANGRAAFMKHLGLYIHIPFCIKKCNYCDFLSIGGMCEKEHALYIDALSAELEYHADKGVLLDSVYIGGGTPSLLEPDLIALILLKVRDCFNLDEGAEITIEANPGLLDFHRLKAYRELGINRLSIGAQSLNDTLLDFMGRVHNSDTFINNFLLARESGFENISIDLIFAIPGQHFGLWMDSLNKVISLNPEHISFYSLQIEAGTPFFRLWENGIMKSVEEEVDRRMYHEAVNRLEDSGYHHYEISNAARPGYESRHNLKYWSMDEYLGIGLGAHSYINGMRFSNETDFEKYLSISSEMSEKRTPSGDNPWVAWRHENTRKDDISEFLFTGLRKIDGISPLVFQQKFGVPLIEVYEESISKHRKSGLLEINKEADRLRLTAKGLDLFNQVLVDFV